MDPDDNLVHVDLAGDDGNACCCSCHVRESEDSEKRQLQLQLDRLLKENRELTARSASVREAAEAASLVSGELAASLVSGDLLRDATTGRLVRVDMNVEDGGTVRVAIAATEDVNGAPAGAAPPTPRPASKEPLHEAAPAGMEEAGYGRASWHDVFVQSPSESEPSTPDVEAERLRTSLQRQRERHEVSIALLEQERDTLSADRDRIARERDRAYDRCGDLLQELQVRIEKEGGGGFGLGGTRREPWHTSMVIGDTVRTGTVP